MPRSVEDLTTANCNIYANIERLYTFTTKALSLHTFSPPSGVHFLRLSNIISSECTYCIQFCKNSEVLVLLTLYNFDVA